VPIGDSVHQERGYLGEYLDILEWVHDIDGLFAPDHVVSWETSDKFLLILFILIFVTLANHGYEALKAHIIEGRFVDKIYL
jgi:hypothetical protein